MVVIILANNNVLNTRDKIIQGAVELFVERGIAQTTTREIASCSHVAEGSIYRYFPSKEQMAWEIFRDYHHQLAEVLQEAIADKATIEDKTRALVSQFLRAADEDWLMFRYYLTAQHTHMHKIDKDSLTPYQIIYKIIKQGMQTGEIEAQDPHLLTAMTMGTVHQVAINKLYKRIHGPLLQYSETIVNAVCRIVLSTN